MSGLVIVCAGCRNNVTMDKDGRAKKHEDRTGKKCPGSGTRLGDVVIARPGGQY